MTRKIALFASGKVGIEVAKYLAASSDEVCVLYQSGLYPDSDDEIYRALSHEKSLSIMRGDIRNDLVANLKLLQEKSVDTLLTVYWPFLIPMQILDIVNLTVNFHPALLPSNRGWYPHVHNILDGSQPGVTLHKLSAAADEGDIWVQKTVETFPWDRASDLYGRLQEEIMKLFSENWPKIRKNEITAYSQTQENQSFHSKGEIEDLDKIELDKFYSGSEILNLLRARTFGSKGFAYFESSGKRIYIRVDLEVEKIEGN